MELPRGFFICATFRSASTDLDNEIYYRFWFLKLNNIFQLHHTLMCEEEAEFVADSRLRTNVLVNDPVLGPVQQHVRVVWQVF